MELTDGFLGGILDGEPLEKQKVTQPMANRLKLLGITYFIGKIKFKLLFHGPLAEEKVKMQKSQNFENSNMFHATKLAMKK